MIDRYTEFLGALRAKTLATNSQGGGIPLDSALEWMVTALRGTKHARNAKAILFGNGGSLTISEHIANDFNLAGWRAAALSGAANLTALGNDVDFASVFERQIEWFVGKGDLIIALSCSGMSVNVLRAARKALAMNVALVTLSASDPGNELRNLGHVNFWVDTSDFGLAQVAHLALLHAICDIGAALR